MRLWILAMMLLIIKADQMNLMNPKVQVQYDNLTFRVSTNKNYKVKYNQVL